MDISFNKETNVLRWTPVLLTDRYVVKMEGGTAPDDWTNEYSVPETVTGIKLVESAYWGNIKETGAKITITALDDSRSTLDTVDINITIPKQKWHQGAAVRLFMLLAVLLGAWASYSQYKLGKANDVMAERDEAKTLLAAQVTLTADWKKAHDKATNQPVVTLYETNVVTVPVYEKIKVYDIPQGMPKAGPATNDTLVHYFSPTNQHTVTKFITDGDGTMFLTPNDWQINCLVYGNVADFDRLVNIGGLTNPHWIHYGPGTKLPEATKVVAYWIRNRVQNSHLKVEFVLTPVASTP